MDFQHAAVILMAFSTMAVVTVSGCTDNVSPGPIVGNDSDSHGCKGSAGYSWCDAKQECIRSWEENCSQPDNLPGAQLANPASTYCLQNLSGTLNIINTPEGQVGYCSLDGRLCEEWELFRTGNCTAPSV